MYLYGFNWQIGYLYILVQALPLLPLEVTMVVPTCFTVATGICRTAVTGLSAVALACSIRAPDVSFVPLV
jgi:hypothetical protein